MENIWKFLNDDLPNPSDDFEIFLQGGGIKKVWDELNSEIIAAWISKHPATRPSLWWEFDSPGHRERVGGIGTVQSDVLAVVPHYEFGIPTGWVSKFLEDYFNGRKVDIHGQKIGTNNEGDFKGKAIDPRDPPRFESQGTYLRRHGLLSESEEHHIEKNQGLLAPEKITE